MEVQLLVKSKIQENSKSFSLNQEKPIVSENDFISFLIIHKAKLSEESVLWLSEVSYELTYVGLTNDNNYIYECLKNISIEEKSNRDFSYYKEPVVFHTEEYLIDFAKIFLNQFGLCEVTIEIDTSKNELFKVGEIEIISNKIRPSNLSYIFDYLIEKCVTYWKPFSLAKSKNKSSSEKQFLFGLLKSVDDDLVKLNHHLYLFKDDPRSRLTSYKEVVPWSDSINTNDSSLQWLATNISVLNRTNNALLGEIRIKNHIYNISEIQSEYLKEDTNVYENQIIHGYLIDICRYFIGRRNTIKSIINQFSLENNEILTLQDRQRLRYYKKLSNDCTLIIKKSESLLDFFSLYLPVFDPRIEPPHRIDGFESKEHYRSLLGPIQNWFSRNKEISFGENELFSGTRSLDKIYELFCLFQVISALENIGFKLIYNPSRKQVLDDAIEESEHSGIYFFQTYLDISLKLHYDRLPDTHQTAIWTKKGYPLKPDFILEYKKKEDSLNKLIIFDAKYKSVKNIKRYTYSEMIPKYLHGIGRRNGEDSNIKALFLLHPEDDNNVDIESWHQSPFRLFDEHPIFPAIGRVEIPTIRDSKSQIERVIKRLLEI